MKIIRNRIKCKKCGDIIESKHRHDFVWCKCDSIAVDGGLTYMKRCFPTTIEEWVEDLSEWELDCDDCIHSEYAFNKGRYELICMIRREKCPDELNKECFVER